MSLTIKQPPLVQVRRAAQSILHGPEILDLVVANKDALIKAAEEGAAPVTAISAKLAKRFPLQMKTAPVRQFVGSAVKAVLASAGYEVQQTGIRLPRDNVFTTGAVYRKIEPQKDKKAEGVREAFAGMVQSMPLAHKRILLEVLQTALGDA